MIWRIDVNERLMSGPSELAVLLGYEPDDLIGRPLSDFLHEEVRLDAGELLERCRQGHEGRLDFRLRSKDGFAVQASIATAPTFDADGRYDGALVTVSVVESPGTVLLVEDEAVVRELVREILEREGYRVIAAPTPADALDASKSADDSIDLLLTDIVMPGMSGPEVAETIEASRAGLKVLYMSGYTDELASERARLKPGTAFIQKPFRAQELTELVRSLLDAA